MNRQYSVERDVLALSIIINKNLSMDALYLIMPVETISIFFFTSSELGIQKLI